MQHRSTRTNKGVYWLFLLDSKWSLFAPFWSVSCPGSCRPVLSEHKNSSSHTSSSNNKKVEVIDLTLDSSSEEEEEEDDDDDNDDEPPPKRARQSLSPTSPPVTKGFVFITVHWIPNGLGINHMKHSTPKMLLLNYYFKWLLIDWESIFRFTSSTLQFYSQLFNFCSNRVLNLHHQASPVTRAPSMPAVETNYIPPPPPLIQDYHHYYHTPSDLSGMRPNAMHAWGLWRICSRFLRLQ